MPDPAKPPYRVPSMDEIKAIPWNGYAVASTFSGGGGSSTGYRLAGYRVLWANEFTPAAQASYRANMASYTTLDGRDIRLVQPEDIFRATGLSEGELDLFDGSPPCDSFSTAGKREAGWNEVRNHQGMKQQTNDLFYEYIRLVRGLQPRTFVAENVSGLVKGAAKGYFLDILRELKACGYRVEAKMLDAQWLGVPQARQRIIYVGVRNDLGMAPAFPKPLSYRYTVRDALPHIRRHGTAPPHQDFIAAGRDIGSTMVDSGRSACPTITAGENKGTGYVEADGRFPPGARVIHDMSGLYSVGDVTDRPSPTVTARAAHLKVDSGEPRMIVANKKFEPVFGSIDNVSPTIMTAPCNTSGLLETSSGAVTERRKFTIAELKRITSFPDDYALIGTYSEQWTRCGMCVPPVMMQHIAAAIRDGVLDQAKKRAAPSPEPPLTASANEDQAGP